MLKSLTFCIDSPFSQVLKSFSAAAKCCGNFTCLNFHSDNDIFKYLKCEKMEYNQKVFAELNPLQPS